MIRLTFCLLVVFWTVPLFGQTGLSEAAKHECERRGSVCQVVRGGVMASESPGLVTAMQPPADDSHKWFITVVSTANCPYCEKLKRDFRESDFLKPWANPANHNESWSHYNEIRVEDQTQAFRWKTYKPTRFPTIIIQPPVNGQFGDPETYLKPIEGYAGNPQVLAATIRARIGEYVEEYDAKIAPKQASLTGERKAPFDVLPPEDKTDTRPFFLPKEQPMPDVLTTLLFPFIAQFPGGLTGLVLVAAGVFYLIRENRKKQGKPLLVPDATVEQIEKIVEQIITKKSAQLPKQS